MTKSEFHSSSGFSEVDRCLDCRVQVCRLLRNLYKDVSYTIERNQRTLSSWEQRRWFKHGPNRVAARAKEVHGTFWTLGPNGHHSESHSSPPRRFQNNRRRLPSDTRRAKLRVTEKWDDELREVVTARFVNYFKSLPRGLLGLDFLFVGDKAHPVVLFSHIPLFRPDSAGCGPLRESGTIRRGAGPNYQSTIGKGVSAFLLDHLHPTMVFRSANTDSH